MSKKTDNDMQENIENSIRVILNKIKDKYMQEKNMYIVVLSKDNNIKNRLEILDCVYQIIITSLQFKRYRRAIRYMVIFNSLCRKTFSERALQEYVKRFDKIIGR